MKTVNLILNMTLSFDPDAGEDGMGSLAAALQMMGAGVANGHLSGPMPNGGDWRINDKGGLTEFLVPPTRARARKGVSKPCR